MASSKNTNNSGSAGNEAGGFKTAAFGFDKNDVTMYIASLRKKMKAIEEEYELKLTQAQQNPTLSGEALKREREVIRAELEKQWNSKILEHTSTIKKQQEQINELEIQLADSKANVESLKEQLASAASAASVGDSGTGSASGAKAAEAYKRFTAELRSISDSAQRTLASIEQIWSGELGSYEADVPVASAPAPAAPLNNSAAVNSDPELGSLIVDEDSFAGLISDINSDYAESMMSAKTEPEPKSAPVKDDAPDDFASLLADSDTDTAAVKADAFEVTPAVAAKGEDLDADLLSNVVIATGEEYNGDDLGKMLKEKEEMEFDAFKDLFVSESAPEIAGKPSDISITPITESAYKPGVSSEFDLTVGDNSDMKGLEDFLVSDDEEVEEVKEEPKPVEKNKEEDLFDFSFLMADDDEDDMSSNVSDF